MATGTLTPTPYQTIFDDNGDPVSGAKITTYQAGTTTLAATYSDVGLTTPNANPIIADAAGRYVAYLSPGASYKFAITTSADVAIRTQDNIGAVPPSSVDVDVVAVAGEAIAANEVVYLSDGTGGRTAGRWYLADGDVAAYSVLAQALGIAPNAIASGATGTVRRDGRVTGLSGLTAGTVYYASGTAGALTSTAPTYPRIVGTADTTTSLILTPSTAGTVTTSEPAIAASVGSNALTLTLTTLAGVAASASTPVNIRFRDATAGTGTVTTVSVAASTTLVVPDTATLGTSNNVPFKLWVVAFNDAGTVRLGIINCAAATSVYPLAGWGLASSTTISTGADSAQVFYSGTGVTTKAYTVLGYVTYESGLATAGTWASVPTRVQPYTSAVPLPGQPVQTVQGTTATEVSSSTNAYVDTGLTATITPTSASHVVLVNVSQAGCAKDTGNTSLSLKLVRASSDILQIETSAGNTGSAARNYFGPISRLYRDSPGTTAATIYKTQFMSQQNTAAAVVQIGSAETSTITLTELAV